MKASIINAIGNRLAAAITGMVPSAARALSRQKQRAGIRMRVGAPRLVTSVTRRRNLNRGRNSGIEINHADGGWKDIARTGASRTLVVNLYGRLILEKSTLTTAYYPKLQLASDNYTVNYSYLNLKYALETSPELTEWRGVTLSWKPTTVCTSINYTRVPQSNDKLAKLVLWYETDKTLDISNPLLERTSMILDMSKTGTKNFNFRLNRRNTKVENLQWITANSSFLGDILLNITAQDASYLNDQSVQEQLLGTFKTSISLRLILKDTSSNMAKAFGIKKAINEKGGSLLTNQEVMLSRKELGTISEEEKEEEKKSSEPND
jgi:hypothetical protein